MTIQVNGFKLRWSHNSIWLEHFTDNEEVIGSSPVVTTINKLNNET